MQIEFHALPKHAVAAIRQSGTDHLGLPVEQCAPDAEGFLCRHCLSTIGPDQPYLTLAYRPFETLNPYSETGPLFLCTDCEQAAPTAQAPAVLNAPNYLIKGYTADERIRYGTGVIVPNAELATRARAILADPEIAFVDVRSAANNCFQCRIKRADPVE